MSEWCWKGKGEGSGKKEEEEERGFGNMDTGLFNSPSSFDDAFILVMSHPVADTRKHSFLILPRRIVNPHHLKPHNTRRSALVFLRLNRSRSAVDASQPQSSLGSQKQFYIYPPPPVLCPSAKYKTALNPRKASAELRLYVRRIFKSWICAGMAEGEVVMHAGSGVDYDNGGSLFVEGVC